MERNSTTVLLSSGQEKWANGVVTFSSISSSFSIYAPGLGLFHTGTIALVWAGCGDWRGWWRCAHVRNLCARLSELLRPTASPSLNATQEIGCSLSLGPHVAKCSGRVRPHTQNTTRLCTNRHVIRECTCTHPIPAPHTHTHTLYIAHNQDYC